MRDDRAVSLLQAEAAVYEEESQKELGSQINFQPVSLLMNGTFSAEFKVNTTTYSSFAIAFRQHKDERVVINTGWAADSLVIYFDPRGSRNEVSWTHHVRNRFITSLDYSETAISDGIIPLTKFKVGPRGWNKLTLDVKDNKAWFYFNDEFISELEIELPDSNEQYFLQFKGAANELDPVDNIYFMRHPTVACID